MAGGPVGLEPIREQPGLFEAIERQAGQDHGEDEGKPAYLS